jgi:hypothetical protein
MHSEIAVDLLRATQLPPPIAATSRARHRGSHTTVASRLVPLKTHIVRVLPHQAARVHSRPHLPLRFHIRAARFSRPFLTRHLHYHQSHRVCESTTQMLWRPTFAGIEVGADPRMSRRRNQLLFPLRPQHPMVVTEFPLVRRGTKMTLLRCLK